MSRVQKVFADDALVRGVASDILDCPDGHKYELLSIIVNMGNVAGPILSMTVTSTAATTPLHVHAWSSINDLAYTHDWTSALIVAGETVIANVVAGGVGVYGIRLTFMDVTL